MIQIKDILMFVYMLTVTLGMLVVMDDNRMYAKSFNKMCHAVGAVKVSTDDGYVCAKIAQ